MHASMSFGLSPSGDAPYPPQPAMTTPLRRISSQKTPAGRRTEEPMEGACEIERLPEELLSAVLARTSPRDTCRAAAVSPAFRAAADDDIIWDRFLPTGGLPPLADEEPPAPAPPSSKKELVLRLSAGPALLQDRLVSVWLDRETGAKCYMLSARNLFGDKPQYWTWIPLKDSRFSEGAGLADVNWLEIHGKIHSKMLSQDTTYAAYMVFKMAADFSGLYFPAQEASVGAGATNLTRKVCLQAEDKNEFYDEGDNEDEYDEEDMDEYYRSLTVRRPVHEENVTFPQKRADGWLEVELGEFFCEGGDDGDVSIGLTDTESGECKSSVIVQGIEIRRKKSG